MFGEGHLVCVCVVKVVWFLCGSSCGSCVWYVMSPTLHPTKVPAPLDNPRDEQDSSSPVPAHAEFLEAADIDRLSIFDWDCWRVPRSCLPTPCVLTWYSWDQMSPPAIICNCLMKEEVNSAGSWLLMLAACVGHFQRVPERYTMYVLPRPKKFSIVNKSNTKYYSCHVNLSSRFFTFFQVKHIGSFGGFWWSFNWSPQILDLMK